MPKRLSEKQKNEILKSFCNGDSLEQLSEEFQVTKLTISNNLKKKIGDKEYKRIINKNKKLKKVTFSKEKDTYLDKKTKYIGDQFLDNNDKNLNNEEFFFNSQFVEITPISENIDNAVRKDFSSVPIEEIDFPNIVYLIVDKKIELEIKYLRDFPNWHFLSQKDLDRKIIQIYFNLKTAKQCCAKEQKLIKVPNTNVFKIVSPLLKSRGITRIICEDKLISL